ncbi:MAG: hypothetical protein ACI8ZN_001714 [Bacteroidia bacterium]|jgi:hypothetical protein
MKASKLIFFIILLLFTTLSAKAVNDSTESKYFVGTDLSFLSQNNNWHNSTSQIIPLYGGTLNTRANNRRTALGLSPHVGYTFNHKWQGGLILHYELIRDFTKNYYKEPSGEYDYLGTRISMAVEPFVRYVLNPLNKFTFFLQQGITLGNISESTPLNYTEKQNVSTDYIVLRTGLGAKYELNSKWRALVDIGTLYIVQGQTTYSDAKTENINAIGFYGPTEFASVSFEYKF